MKDLKKMPTNRIIT